MYQYAIPLAAIIFPYLLGGGNRLQQASGEGRQDQGVLQNLVSNWGEMMRKMGFEATAEDVEEKRRKEDEERKKMEDQRQKEQDDEYERQKREDQKRADRRREEMKRAAEEDEERDLRERDLYSRKTLAPPAPRRSHHDDSIAASADSAAGISDLIKEAMRLPPRSQQVQYADGDESWKQLLWTSDPYRRAYPELFGAYNPTVAPGVYPDSGYSSMAMNEPPPGGNRSGSGMNYDRAAQRALETSNGSVERSRWGGPGSGSDFGSHTVGQSRERSMPDEQGPGEAASYFDGDYDRTGSSRAGGPDVGRAMGDHLDRDMKREQRGRDKGRERRGESPGEDTYRGRRGPDFNQAYAQNARRDDSRDDYRQRSRGYDEDGGRRTMRTDRRRRRAEREYREGRSRMDYEDDYDERYRETRRGGRSRSRYDEDDYDRRCGSGRSRDDREERDAYNRRRRLDPHAKDHEDHPSHPDDGHNGRHGADGHGATVGAGAGLFQTGAPGGPTIINNNVIAPGMMPSVVLPAEPAGPAEVSVPEPAPLSTQIDTGDEEKPTRKVEPAPTPWEQREQKDKARRDLWAERNTARISRKDKAGTTSTDRAGSRVKTPAEPSQQESLPIETIIEAKPTADDSGNNFPRDSGVPDKSTDNTSERPDGPDVPSNEPRQDSDHIQFKDRAPQSDTQSTSNGTIGETKSSRVTTPIRNGSRVDSAVAVSPTQTGSSGNRQTDSLRGGEDSSTLSKDPKSPFTNPVYDGDETSGIQSPAVSPKTDLGQPTLDRATGLSDSSRNDSAISMGYDDRKSEVEKHDTATSAIQSPIMDDGGVTGDARRQHGIVKGTQRQSHKAELAEISPVTASNNEHPTHGILTGASSLEEPADHVGLDATTTTTTTSSTSDKARRKRRMAEKRMRDTTKNAMQAQSSVLKRHNVTGPKTFGRLIKLALKSSPKMAFLSSVVTVIYLIGAVYLGNQVANMLQLTAPSARLTRRQSLESTSSATTTAANSTSSTFAFATFESFEEDTQMLILINLWHATSWLVLVSLAHYIWENIPDPDGPRARKNWLDKFGLWSMLRVLVTVAPMSLYLLLGARQLTSCAYLLNDPDAIAWSMGPDVGLTWNYLSENNGSGASASTTVDAPVQDMDDWQLLLLSIFFWLTGIPVLLYSIKRVQYPGSLSRVKIVRKVESRYRTDV